jgi:hypothetical protein
LEPPCNLDLSKSVFTYLTKTKKTANGSSLW